MLKTFKFGCLVFGSLSFRIFPIVNAVTLSEDSSNQDMAACRSTKKNGENGLILYYHHHSFYAQKVVMALYEKKIPFKGHNVDITKGEQYQPWFLCINPRGEVPVLKDGIKIIPDSARIIEYLEDNFSNGDAIRLVPTDQGSDVKKRINYFAELIDTIPANVITIGSIINSEFCNKLKYPFSLSTVRNHLKAADDRSSASLRALAEKNPDSRDVLLQKAANQDKKHQLVTDRTSFMGLLDQTAKVLDEVEKELASHTGDKADWWLCTDRFTVADIALTILLDRLSRIGLEEYFWSTKPHLTKYYERVQHRDSYKKTVPGPWTDISQMLKDKAPWLFGVGLVTVIAVFLGTFCTFRK